MLLQRRSRDRLFYSEVPTYLDLDNMDARINNSSETDTGRPPEPRSECDNRVYAFPYSWHRNNATAVTTSSRDEMLMLTRRGEVLVCRRRQNHSHDHSNDYSNATNNIERNLNGNRTACSISSAPGRVLNHRDYHEPPTLERLRIHEDHGQQQQSVIQYDPPTPPSRTRNHSTSHHHNHLSSHSTTSTGPFSPLYGVPTFLHHLSQIRITKISAHPQGQHVLLISTEGLLFSYGSNEFGQLGLGRNNASRTLLSSSSSSSSPPNSPLSTNNGVSSPSSTTTSPSNPKQHPFEKTTVPSIVTSLLENGGKSINCAAGIDYSLVVVKTEGARMAGGGRRRRHRKHQEKKTSNVHRMHHDGGNGNGIGEQQQHTNTAHHQLYAFGNNDHGKLGLHQHADRSHRDDTRVRGNNATTTTSQEASFSPPSSPGSLADSSVDDGMSEASSSTCVYLPRRVALECTVIPECMSGPSSLPPYGIYSIAASIHHSTALVRRPSGEIELYTWGKDHAVGLESPVSLSTSETQYLGRIGGNGTDDSKQSLPPSKSRNHDVVSTQPLSSSDCLECEGDETELDKKLRRHVNAQNNWHDHYDIKKFGDLELWYEEY